MILRRIGLLAIAGVLALAGSAALAPALSPQVAHADTPTVLKVGMTEDIDTLNPFTAVFASSTNIGRMMYEFLTTYDQKTQAPVPALADSWSHSADGLTWTFHIRDNAKWSDGQPVTAKDAAFTFNLMMTNTDAATANGNFVANFAKVTTTDDHTLVITTKQPQATMLALDVPIVPQHVWQGVTNIGKFANAPTPGHPIVGDGPFILTDYKQGQYVKLAANKNYWRGAPKIDELQYVQFDDVNAAESALVKGDVDLLNNLTPTQFNALKNTKNITTNEGEGSRFVDMIINSGTATNANVPIGTGNPNLKDVKLRQAIAEAIDPAELVKNVYGGYAQPGTSYIPPRFATYHWNPTGAQLRKFDPAAANAALDAADYPKGPDGIRVGHDGKALTLTLIGDASQTQDSQEAQYIKGWLQAVGIGVNINLVSSNKLNDLTNAGDFDLAFSGYGVDPDPDYVLSIQTCAQRPNAQGLGGTTESFFCNAQYDQLYAKQLSDMDPAKRAGDVKQMEQIFYDQVPEVTLLYKNNLEAYRSDRWAPFAIQPDPGGQIMFQNGYWSYLEATPLTSASSSGGVSVGLVIGIVAAVIVIVVLVVVLTRRRRVASDDRE
ncbi:MAG TPA: ABC transporter substrate-binding protein [Pseudonocardiaceae bacterium]|jgi:peptide/nickel transport system substrate-binding protein|nr:ABC transporter substrate-binding protein [Pseudonocardiaceae bacterium]